MKQHCPSYEVTPDRPAVFFGGRLDGRLVPLELAASPSLQATGEMIFGYRAFDVLAYGIALTVWCHAGSEPVQYIDRIRLYLSTGLRTHPRPSARCLESLDN